jgi:hypothetical protein
VERTDPSRITQAMADPPYATRRTNHPANRRAWRVVAALVGLALLGGAAQALQTASGPREFLAALGVDVAAWGEFRDDQPLGQGAEREMLLRLVHHLRRLDVATIDRWTRREAAPGQVQDNPQSWRGEFVPVAGRVLEVAIEPLAPDLAQRFEIDSLYRCQVDLIEGGKAIVFTTRIPSVWPLSTPLDEPVRAAGLFLKRTDDGEQPALLLAANRLEWAPQQVRPEWNVSPGLVRLAALGVDAGLADQIEERASIAASERELFYQILSAAGRTSQGELIAAARGQIAKDLPAWNKSTTTLENEVHWLEAQIARPDAPPNGSPERAEMVARLAALRQQWAAARTRVEQGERGLDSVVDLFNDPASQFGRLVLLEGTARRAVPIQVQVAGQSANKDVAARWDVDRYFEVEFFAPDSQNNPIVVCTRTLPEGFPVGDAISQPIRVAGFFYKSWAFTARGPAAGDPSSERPVQLAPLLISGGVQWIPAAPRETRPIVGVAAGLLFVAALLLVWWSVWRNSRRNRNISRSSEAAPGETSPEAFLQGLADEHAAPPP